MSKFKTKLKEKEKYIIRGIIVFILFFCSSYLQYIPIYLLHIDIQQINDEMSVVLSTFSSLILLFLFYLLYREELKKEFQIFRSHLMENLDTGFQYWISGLFIMMVSNTILNVIFKVGGANNEEAVQSMIQALPWLMVIDAGIIAPINEEIVFRKTLKDIFRNKWILMFLSFILFGGAHVIFSAESILDYLYIIPYGALGASFALADYETDTVFTSITFHMLHNLILTILSIYMTLL